MNRLKPLTPLEGDQRRASSPADHAALSASAGTGKTHVLTARVLRLLLGGADPASILCLTFTKAGAAEMADRIHARLAHWVRLKDADLRKELFALGEPNGPEDLEKARRLFARVLESAGGGLRIQTIHAFAQALLAAFPSEAGLAPGFRPLEGREEQLLARSTLADLLVRAEGEGDHKLVRDVQALSLRLGEGGAEAFLTACARAGAGLAALGPREGIEPRLRLAFELPLGDVDEAIAEACGDETFDVAALRRLSRMNADWATKSGLDRADLCARWLAAEPAERAALLGEFHQVWAKADGDPRSFGRGQAPPDPEYAGLASALFDCCSRLLGIRRAAAYVADLAAGLRAGQAFAAAYAAAKRSLGVVDFDDLIARAVALLRTEGMGEWVRYKLDRQTDHILVDEAQDTNAAQWEIVGALAGEFFAGESASGRHRTLFTVGDFKQAIFSFQGTNPREFERAREHFAERARALRDAAEAADRPRLPPDFLDLSMDRSFRSAPPVLAAVDAVIDRLGHDAFGLPRPPNPHRSHHRDRPGSVTLWRAYTDEVEGDEAAGEEGWVAERVRRYAARLAGQLREWLENPFRLDCRGRPLRPEDILVLVRSRGELASLLVARLHAEGVPVAGLDRLRLSAPLAVQDLLAAARFAVQPRDDLNLAALLVSPLFGWSQDRLFEASFGRPGALWPHLRSADKADEATLAGLHEILAMADYASPHRFFEAILSGPFDGRRRLFGRLGQEARDPVEELLSAALAFETGDGPAPSLQAFLDWFARGDVEVVRDPSAALDAVRVMTVHGSKGLQAPVVILADACADPDRKSAGGIVPLPVGGHSVPALRPRKDERFEPLATVIADKDRRDREEHWRLLYVAMTRAEERLYVGGALSLVDRNGPPEASWYRAVEGALAGLGAAPDEHPRWGAATRFGPAETPCPPPARRAEARPAAPDWLSRPAPQETRPPRPLAPSAAPEDSLPYPPPGPDQRRAALRGKLLHQLFERLPAVAPDRRAEAARRWLDRSAGVDDAAFRDSLVADACRIVADPDHAELFGPDALAEAPVAAVIAGGHVVSGAVDRLVIAPDRILVADFKTGRRVPAAPAEIPVPHLRQMAAYAAALAAIFPGRTVEAALLYTGGPVLHRLPAPLLAAHLPG